MRSAKQFRGDLKTMQDLVKNLKTDLFAKIPWGDGKTSLREALLIADHNAYHLAQLVDVRRALGAWKEVERETAGGVLAAFQPLGLRKTFRTAETCPRQEP